ncbi:MAG: DUF421 domain-containing protein [Burkholderiales bacterium]|nr:DUF421 domain-containing protein [Burkholderiales bacterium]
MHSLDLAEIFRFSLHPAELVIRGTAMYWFLFCIFRFALRRDVGSIGIADVLLIVLIADASQNAMAGEYRSVADGAVLVATLVGWNVLMDWAAFRFDALARVMEVPPLLLIHRGRIVHRNLRREFLKVEELQAELRKQGVDDISRVRAAYMESDGHISVLKFDG